MNPHPEPSLLAAIRLVVSDVDGVLTDGKIYTSDGADMIAFDVKDGLGMKRLQEAGIKVAWLSARGGAAMERRAAKLGIDKLVTSSEDKLDFLRALVRELLGSEDLKAVAYLGDDLPDLPCIQAVGMGVAVADASQPVRKGAAFVTSAVGGRGAMRELSDILVAARK